MFLFNCEFFYQKIDIHLRYCENPLKLLQSMFHLVSHTKFIDRYVMTQNIYHEDAN